LKGVQQLRARTKNDQSDGEEGELLTLNIEEGKSKLRKALPSGRMLEGPGKRREEPWERNKSSAFSSERAKRKVGDCLGKLLSKKGAGQCGTKENLLGEGIQ